MAINNYLKSIANQALLRDVEKVNVQRSIAALQRRMDEYFDSELSDHFVFGSYSRGTILPRLMDPQSDVDYMVIFSDNGLRPQSYLDRLRRFAEVRYTRSEIAQSHPTVVLNLNHIRFELVPAIDHWWGGLQIPAKSNGYQSWQQTDPKGFNAKLTNANQNNANLIKPLVRIMKYWNIKAGYPFESYELEQQIANHDYGLFGLLAPQNIKGYFFQIVDAIEVGRLAPQRKCDAVAQLKLNIDRARVLEQRGQINQAECLIAQILPPVLGLYAY